ncbi:hypothetical protein KQX63_17535 [Rhodopseudomonas palustris]|jgi:dCMP deaminase|uniref:hypothetical protein n=1 Tax=Rhodopseudomonas palustris TaxID=1076 RepID=UPI0021F2772D|nr:hypothetical protein [Rhodopseudomonas palustris]UYO43173.1 hypothetical protein KQX63_17535 [Rhodopseudomonas palustris]
MALLLEQALTGDQPAEFPKEVSSAAEANATNLKALTLLRRPGSLSPEECHQLIEAYEKSAQILRAIKKTTSLSQFISMMQHAGDKIRLYGGYREGTPHPNNMIVLPEAIRRILRAYRTAQARRRFVIDAFRNPFEVEYFKRRYAEFYLICLYRSPENRGQSLAMRMPRGEVEKIWEKESGRHPADGRSETDFPKNRENIAWWITGQDIPACAQKADVFISPRTGEPVHLKYQIARLLALIHKPGSLTPSRDEHAMQIAATARRMSGCLSRQVGAAVVNPLGYVLGIGWNDPPDGQIPCSLRSCEDLLEVSETDNRDYSRYEKAERFRNHIELKNGGATPFCFRSELALILKERRAEYTRALHAEENAFLQTAKMGGVSLVGSTLYTTASTCTLCAKKAYHLRIDRIVFIDQYDDMARDQTLLGGQYDIKYEQFEGITGAAYCSLFSPLIPEKDLLEDFGTGQKLAGDADTANHTSTTNGPD